MRFLSTRVASTPATMTTAATIPATTAVDIELLDEELLVAVLADEVVEETRTAEEVVEL